MTLRLHLVRHGEVHNPAGVIYGTLPGFGLSAHGRAQAEATARHLGALVRGRPCIVASPLDRARQTAEVIREVLAEQFGELTVTIDIRLLEARSFAEGLPRAFAPLSYARRLLDGDRPPNDSPSLVLDRMVAAARAACGPHEDAILVSHQFPIWMARTGLEQTPEQRARAFVARRAPWLFVRQRCGLASVTTVLLDDPRPTTTTYWEPSV